MWLFTALWGILRVKTEPTPIFESIPPANRGIAAEKRPIFSLVGHFRHKTTLQFHRFALNPHKKRVPPLRFAPAPHRLRESIASAVHSGASITLFSPSKGSLHAFLHKTHGTGA
jgi:hypothetical protein